MDQPVKDQVGYLHPVEIAEGIYWVGFADGAAGLHCNPYLIVDGDEAVLIDGGSRDEFSTVMLKILRTGIEPSKIKRLIYQHFDPDLCGNLPHLEAIINSPGLRIISHRENNAFISYYSSQTPKLCIESLGYHHQFSSGRRLEFIRTPYAHAAGSFITYDTKTKTLFTSDIFGSYDHQWRLYLELGPACRSCQPEAECPLEHHPCPLYGIVRFHQRVMTSKIALEYALDRIASLDVAIIAPQHGSLIRQPEDKERIIRLLRSVQEIGIDYYLQGEREWKE